MLESAQDSQYESEIEGWRGRKWEEKWGEGQRRKERSTEVEEGEGGRQREGEREGGKEEENILEVLSDFAIFQLPHIVDTVEVVNCDKSLLMTCLTHIWKKKGREEINIYITNLFSYNLFAYDKN